MFWKKKAIDEPSDRDQAIAAAHSALATKREEIGDAALDKIRKAIIQHETSLTEKAKKEILAADIDKVTDNIKFMLDEPNR